MKLKSHSGMKKRIKLNAKRKFFFKKACRNHLLLNKSKRQKRIAQSVISETHQKSVARMLPN